MTPTSTRRAEKVHALNLKKLAQMNLDARSLDRLRWAEGVCEHALSTPTTVAVIVRRALALYARELDRLLKSSDEETRRREARALRRAAKGNTDMLPEDALTATPPRPFAEIEAEARDEYCRKARANLFAPLDV